VIQPRRMRPGEEQRKGWPVRIRTTTRSIPAVTRTVRSDAARRSPAAAGPFWHIGLDAQGPGPCPRGEGSHADPASREPLCGASNSHMHAVAKGPVIRSLLECLYIRFLQKKKKFLYILRRRRCKDSARTAVSGDEVSAAPGRAIGSSAYGVGAARRARSPVSCAAARARDGARYLGAVGGPYGGRGRGRRHAGISFALRLGNSGRGGAAAVVAAGGNRTSWIRARTQAADWCVHTRCLSFIFTGKQRPAIRFGIQSDEFLRCFRWPKLPPLFFSFLLR